MTPTNQTVVLLVEDEYLIRESAAEALAEAGCEVLETATGEGALAYLKERGASIGVLFTDIQLGGHLSGWDVAEAFRAINPQRCVVYTSGNTIDRRRQVSGSRFLTKPYQLAEAISACGCSTSKDN